MNFCLLLSPYFLKKAKVLLDMSWISSLGKYFTVSARGFKSLFFVSLLSALLQETSTILGLKAMGQTQLLKQCKADMKLVGIKCQLSIQASIFSQGVIICFLFHYQEWNELLQIYCMHQLLPPPEVAWGLEMPCRIRPLTHLVHHPVSMANKFSRAKKKKILGIKTEVVSKVASYWR